MLILFLAYYPFLGRGTNNGFKKNTFCNCRTIESQLILSIILKTYEGHVVA
jgi:hypothetical protein